MSTKKLASDSQSGRNLPLDWDVQVGDVVQTEVDQALEVILSQV